MNIPEILAQFERNDRHFPRQAVEEAAVRREEITPELLGVLEKVARDPDSFAEGDHWIHIYAMFLLAQFREPRAYPLLVKIFSAPGETPFDLAGDVVTEDLSHLLASVSGGDPAGMMALVENEQANEYVRSAALDGLVTLVTCGQRSREEVMTYFGRLFHTLERTPSMAWDGLAAACADLCPVEVEKDLRQAYKEGLIDPGYIAWREIPEALARGPEAALERARRQYRLITNVVEEMEWWSCFREPGDINRFEKEEDNFSRLLGGVDVPPPFRRTQPKVGRNEPCPCGSGKKFKKCCGR